MLKFDDLQDLLGGTDAGIRAAECHGFLTGFLCVSETVNDSVLQYLCADLDGAGSLPLQDRSALLEMGHEISNQILSADLEFQLLQPDESTPFADRCDALAEWCRGFLSGLGMASSVSWPSVSEPCQEMLADISDISRLGTESGDMSEDEIEASLMELYEYVRMGVIYLHDEFALLQAEHERPGVLH
ncbi:MAG: UPF0149 family protein [Thiotrichales bacterium]|nr:UPF0149 family protein [Thiotrichales bacterium]